MRITVMARSGFSLLEVLVAVAVVSVALFPLLALDRGAYRQTRVTSLHMEAGVRAREAICRAASMDYDALLACASREKTLWCSAPAEAFPGEVLARVEVAAPAREARRPLLLVTVTVNWSPHGLAGGPGRGTFELHRVIADPVASMVSDHDLTDQAGLRLAKGALASTREVGR